MIHKKAFTLAEVLITLTIIGVIAAITIPNLIQSYKKHEVEVKVREMYSILGNAIKMAEAQYGEINGDYTKILEYLKITKQCSTKDKCFKDKLGTGTCINGLNVNSKMCSGSFDNRSYILSNGMAIWFTNDLYGYAYGSTQINFIVDINGLNKGKNQLGYDIFTYTYRHHAQFQKEIQPYFEAGSLWILAEPDYKRGSATTNYSDTQSIYSLDEILGTGLSGGCNYNAKSQGNAMVPGARCAAAIQKNGWKIPDDYPVKKF